MGIPNTVHFQDVTTFDDAIACTRCAYRARARTLAENRRGPPVWERIKRDKQTIEFRQDVEEEYEDAHGNVMSRKTFEDMRRQGLL
jgi:splicing factor 3A subunit 3